MGKSKLKLVRTQQTKLTVTGIMADVNMITYQDEDGNDKLANVEDLLEPFVGKEVTFVVTEKIDDDMTV